MIPQVIGDSRVCWLKSAPPKPHTKLCVCMVESYSVYCQWLLCMSYLAYARAKLAQVQINQSVDKGWQQHLMYLQACAEQQV